MAITNKSSRKFLIAMAVLLGILANQNALASGADGNSYNSFQPETYVPKVDIASYAAGNVGVVPASYWRVYQFLAYRALTGNPLSKAETDLLNINQWRVDNTVKVNRYAYEKSDGVASWLEARAKVPSAASVKTLGVDASAGNYNSYENCPVDAFNRAAQTLNDRAKTATEVQLKLWLDGQDAVFKNCNSKRSWDRNKIESDANITVILPAELAEKPPLWLQQDRQYQLAAAYFYAEKFDEARRRFIAIGADKTSAWQPYGAHLAARCLVRRATLYFSPDDVPAEQRAVVLKKQKALLSQARIELLPLSKGYLPAQQLLGFIDAQLQPVERLTELGLALAEAKITAASAQQIIDYVFLLTRADNAEIIASKAPMTAWIGLMQAANNGSQTGSVKPGASNSALEIARKNWQADKSKIFWLLPVYANLNASAKTASLNADERKAVQSIAETSPYFQPLNYALAEALIAEKKLNEADEIVTRVLAKQKNSMIKSTRNRWLGLKVSTAKTQAEFFAALPRELADIERPSPIPNEAVDKLKTAALLDSDYDDRLYHDFSNADLFKLLSTPNFPSRDKNYVLTQVIFTRALAMEDYDTANKLGDELARDRATTSHLYQRLKADTTPDAKRITAAVILVNTPELGTAVFANQYSENYRGCAFGKSGEPQICDISPPNFMAAANIAAAQKEQLILRKWRNGEDFLSRTLIDWAKLKPADIEAPKALHFLITTKRVTGKPSREAFQLLHKNYPDSQWAKKTKYYY